MQLVDFGIAHVSADAMTRRFYTAAGMATGTVQCRAREQLSRVRDDPRVDVYAVGVLLYRMMAGRPYLGFQTETTPAAQAHNIHLIQQQSPIPLHQVNPLVPGWLAQAVDQALRKAPGERYPSARAMHNALRGEGQHPQRQEQLPPTQLMSAGERKPVPVTEGVPGAEDVLAQGR